MCGFDSCCPCLHATTKISKFSFTNKTIVPGFKKAVHKPKSSLKHANTHAYQPYKKQPVQQRRLTKLGKVRTEHPNYKRTIKKRFSSKYLLSTNLPFRTRLRLFNTLRPQQRVLGLNHFASFKQTWDLNFHVFGAHNDLKCLYATDLSYPNDLKLKSLTSPISTK